jgi:hypothetical protein
LVSQHHITTTSLLISPDYLKLRSTLVTALRPFPDAGRAVGAALHLLEADAAADISSRATKPRTTPAPLTIEHSAAPVIRPIGPPPC